MNQWCVFYLFSINKTDIGQQMKSKQKNKFSWKLRNFFILIRKLLRKLGFLNKDVNLTTVKESSSHCWTSLNRTTNRTANNISNRNRTVNRWDRRKGKGPPFGGPLGLVYTSPHRTGSPMQNIYIDLYVLHGWAGAVRWSINTALPHRKPHCKKIFKPKPHREPLPPIQTVPRLRCGAVRFNDVQHWFKPMAKRNAQKLKKFSPSRFQIPTGDWNFCQQWYWRSKLRLLFRWKTLPDADHFHCSHSFWYCIWTCSILRLELESLPTHYQILSRILARFASRSHRSSETLRQ